MTNLAITGTTGRMGQMLIKEIYRSTQCQLSAALSRKGNPVVGQDVGNVVGLPPFGVEITDNVKKAVEVSDVLVDFSRPEATLDYLNQIHDQPIPLVICTTGLKYDELDQISNAAAKFPILLAPNTSYGIVLLRKLSREMAKFLGPDYDVEIIDMHHRDKVDAPSGTAAEIGKEIAEIPGFHLNTRADKNGRRERGAVELMVSRGGAAVGDHSVMFAGDKEVITLSHRAFDRSLFAQGAVKAALWIKDQKPGLYSMDDMMDL